MSSPFAGIGEQDIRSTSTVQGGIPLGSLSGTPDGRLYKWALAGGTTLAPGKVVVTPAHAANHVNRTVAAAVSVGDFKVTATMGATAVTQDQYKGGFLTVNDEAGEGATYLIEGNDAAASSGVVTVQLAEAVKVALTTSSEVSLQVSPYSAVIVGPGNSLAHQAVGVPNVSVTNATYGWVQVSGYCSVLSDGVISKGAGATLSGADGSGVAGAVEIEAAATVNQRVGTAPEATVDGEYRLINLTLL